MIANLKRYFPSLKSICWFDEDKKEVYLESERVMIENTVISGYVRRDGTRELTPINAHIGEYEVKQSLVFVGCVPNGNLANIIRGVEGCIIGCNTKINATITDKILIADSEGIDLSKFTNVALIKVEYDYESIETINECPELNICMC